MLAKAIKYTDYNNEEREETFYFNLTRVEILEMEIGKEGGLQNYINTIIAAKDTVKIYECFKAVLLKAYGRKSEDGRRFEKSKDISKSFEECPAFDELIMGFIENADSAADFFNALVPKEKNSKLEAVK